MEAATAETNSVTSKPSSMCNKVRTMRPSPPHKCFLAGCSSPFIYTYTTNRASDGALRVCCYSMRCLVWSVKTRRRPSRHSRDAWAYGLMATAVHKTRSTKKLAHFGSLKGLGFGSFTHTPGKTVNQPNEPRAFSPLKKIENASQNVESITHPKKVK